VTTPESLATATPVLESTWRTLPREELQTPGGPGKTHRSDTVQHRRATCSISSALAPTAWAAWSYPPNTLRHSQKLDSRVSCDGRLAAQH